LPGVYTVTNVTAGDVLWVRSEPTAFSAPVTNLAPDAVVSVLGMGAPDWAEIYIDNSIGYVDAHYLTRGGGVTTSSGLQMNLMCLGAEPFWSLDVDQDRTVTYTLAGSAPLNAALNQATASTLTGGYPYIFGAQPMSGVINQELCSDGMSEITYPWSITLNAPNEAGNMMTANGCCRLR